jgi:GDSL-like Lipase/Acylhydrolase family
MKKLLRRLAQGLAILAITLALDFALTNTLLSGVREQVSKAESENWYTYIETKPYEHGLIANKDTERAWGRIVYSWKTDRYGFRTGDCAPKEPDRNRPAVFVIGDSFVEGMGTTFEKSFPGLIACDAARDGKAAWNLGVASYSPIIYHLKIKAAAEQLGVTPKSIYLFLDLSDIDDDANVYQTAADGSVEKTPVHYTPFVKGTPFDLGKFVLNNFSTARLAYDLWVASSFSYQQSLGRDRARWAFDPVLMEKWGKRGLSIASANLDKVVALCRQWDCRLTLGVYPWPDNIVAGDRDSVQVTYWRDWARERGVRFVDAFAPFFREPPGTTLEKYYFAGDVHFNDDGNRLMFETVRQAVGGSW